MSQPVSPAPRFLDQVLDPPHYGFENQGQLVIPTHAQIFKEFFSRLNVFRTQKTWLPFFSWFAAFTLVIPFYFFFAHYFTWPLFVVAFVYSMMVLGTHGTIWLHRYSTHRSFVFKDPITRFLVRNLTPRVIPEEVYVISHHVHHFKSEKPGDPYNPHAGWLYCFLADANHQCIRRDLSEEAYDRLVKLMTHTGMRVNTYAQYQRYGSISNPFTTVLHFALNWSFWFFAFYLIGGMALSVTIFAATAVWAFGVRTFNYDGHGGGKDKRQKGIDFCASDYSINQKWAGYVAGEWHNNHHLYPNSARSGFLPYQFDSAWVFIHTLEIMGRVTAVKDQKPDFYREVYEPYLKALDSKNLSSSFSDITSQKQC